MKKYAIILVLVLGFTLVSCGNDDVEDNVETEDITQEKEQTEVDEVKTESIEEIKEFSEYKIIGSDEGIYIIQKNGEEETVGLMNIDGEIILEPIYYDVSYSEGIAVIQENNETVDITDDNYYYAISNGTKLFDEVNGQKIAVAGKFEDGYALVRLFNNDDMQESRNYLVDEKGNVILENIANDNKYFSKVQDDIYALTDDVVLPLGNIYELYNTKGEKVSAETLEHPENYNNDNLFEYDGLYYERNPETIMFATYDKVKGEAITDYNIVSILDKVGENYVVLKDNGSGVIETYIIDKLGNVVLGIDNAYSSPCETFVIDDKVVVNYSNISKTIIFDSNGKLVKETEYEYVEKKNDDTLVSFKDGKYGYLNEDFTELLPTEYDYLSEVYEGTSLMVKDNNLYKFSYVE